MEFSSDTLTFFVLVGLENDVKGAFQVKTPPFGETVNFRVNVEVHVLKNALKLGEVISQQHVFLLSASKKSLIISDTFG